MAVSETALVCRSLAERLARDLKWTSSFEPESEVLDDDCDDFFRRCDEVPKRPCPCVSLAADLASLTLVALSYSIVLISLTLVAFGRAWTSTPVVSVGQEVGTVHIQSCCLDAILCPKRQKFDVYSQRTSIARKSDSTDILGIISLEHLAIVAACWNWRHFETGKRVCISV